MVTTRSMSRSNPSSKSGATKTVKPPKVVERNSTRRKSGTPKTVKPPECIERPNSTRRKSGTAKTVKPPKVIERFNSARREALSIFMIKEYLSQYNEANPPPRPTGFVREEIVRSGHVKWFYMSESEKAPWIKLVEKMLAKGISLRYTTAREWLVYLLFVYHIGWYLLCSSICFPELTV